MKLFKTMLVIAMLVATLIGNTGCMTEYSNWSYSTFKWVPDGYGGYALETKTEGGSYDSGTRGGIPNADYYQPVYVPANSEPLPAPTVRTYYAGSATGGRVVEMTPVYREPHHHDQERRSENRGEYHKPPPKNKRPAHQNHQQQNNSRFQ
jgi:hypothetical protein